VDFPPSFQGEWWPYASTPAHCAGLISSCPFGTKQSQFARRYKMNSKEYFDRLSEFLAAKCEIASLDYKSNFDSKSKRDWCELLKDIVAIANSGGGIVIIGINDDGSPSGCDIQSVLDLDPADVCDKIKSYTDCIYSDFRIVSAEFGGKCVGCFVLGASQIPMIFTRPGSYQTDGPKQQETAFSRGTIYFRHGAKSETGTSEDLRLFVEREIERLRSAWLENVRKVIEAPPGSHVVIMAGSGDISSEGRSVRLTTNPEAPLVRELDPNQSHPHRQMDVARKVSERLGSNYSVTRYDVYCIRKAHDIENKPQFFYKPKHSSGQFSNEFIDWFVDEYKKKPRFVEESKLHLKKLGGSYSHLEPTDQRLQKLEVFMKKSGLNNSTLAKKVGLSVATISQLRNGKYPGDVETVFKRIEDLQKAEG
jgi:DNA-binding XRE family transcriptional regulator